MWCNESKVPQNLIPFQIPSQLQSTPLRAHKWWKFHMHLNKALERNNEKSIDLDHIFPFFFFVKKKIACGPKLDHGSKCSLNLLCWNQGTLFPYWWEIFYNSLDKAKSISKRLFGRIYLNKKITLAIKSILDDLESLSIV